MAQLIKLYDYISRYESNPFHYPTQFIRLKQENWQKLNEFWEMEREQSVSKQENQFIEEMKRLKWNPFSKKIESKIDQKDQFVQQLPKTKKQLTQFFLNELFPFQLKWATSTISHVSYTEQNHRHDDILKYFLQRFPDIYLLMYYPIFSIKKAPIDGDIILISPIGIDIIFLINEEPQSTIIVSDDRTWTIETELQMKRIISPIISLKRTEQIVKSILQTHNISFTINKIVLSQTSNFLYATQPYNTLLIGEREYDEWYTQKRNLSSPLKNIQLKVIEALLHHCITTSVRRPEWEDDDLNMSPISFGE